MNRIAIPTSRELTERELKLVEEASNQFWSVIAEGLPHIHSGDYPPDATAWWEEECREHVRYWIHLNEGAPATTQAVYEELLVQLHQAGRVDLQDLVTHEYPGYIDIRVTDSLTFGFDPDEVPKNKSAWRCLIKPYVNGEDLGFEPVGSMIVEVADVTDAVGIAAAIIKVAFKGVNRG